MLGPVQVLVVDVTDPKSARAVMASLPALAPEGPVRCLDVFECTVDDAGELSVTAQDGRQPLSLPLFAEFFETGLVPRLPTAVLVTGLMILAFMSFVAGLILDTVTHGRRELKRLHYLGLQGPTFRERRRPADEPR